MKKSLDDTIQYWTDKQISFYGIFRMTFDYSMHLYDKNACWNDMKMIFYGRFRNWTS